MPEHYKTVKINYMMLPPSITLTYIFAIKTLEPLLSTKASPWGPAPIARRIALD